MLGLFNLRFRATGDIRYSPPINPQERVWRGRRRDGGGV